MTLPVRRRDFLAAGIGSILAGAALSSPRLPVPAGNRIYFDIVRKGSVIGAHELRFHPDARTLAVEVVVDIAIGLGPLTLFHYKHRALEKWQDGEILSIDATTDDNGRQSRVSGKSGPGGFVVDGPRGHYLAPPGTLPATHWNRRMLNGPMLNTQTGALMRPHIADLGIDSAPTRTGMVRARHFAMTGDAVLDTWYDDGPNWVALDFKGSDGSLIRYERQA